MTLMKGIYFHLVETKRLIADSWLLFKRRTSQVHREEKCHLETVMLQNSLFQSVSWRQLVRLANNPSPRSLCSLPFNNKPLSLWLSNSFTDSVTHQTCFEPLLCARNCGRYWAHNYTQDKDPAFTAFVSWKQEMGNVVGCEMPPLQRPPRLNPWTL